MKRPYSVDVAQLGEFDTVIDVRTPAEFALDHVPGAVNRPVLSNEERAHVGTTYTRISAFEGRKLGAALVSRNIADHIERDFSARDRDWRPLVYCWRGGQRSGAMAHVLREIGWQAHSLAGGYKAFRREVIAQLGSLPGQFRYRVVCGATGTGKSRLLEALSAAGEQVLDLEAIACHRGSVLGDLPDAPQPAQRLFETRVWDALRGLDRTRPVFVEAESRKIGRVQLPEALLQCMRAAPCALIQAPLEARVTFLIREYRHYLEDPSGLRAALARLHGLHANGRIERWAVLADAGAWVDLVGELLTEHYDPAYRRSMLKNYPGLKDAQVLATDRLDGAAISALTERLSGHGGSRIVS